MGLGHVLKRNALRADLRVDTPVFRATSSGERACVRFA